jgi:hypothetical protein
LNRNERLALSGFLGYFITGLDALKPAPRIDKQFGNEYGHDKNPETGDAASLDLSVFSGPHECNPLEMGRKMASEAERAQSVFLLLSNREASIGGKKRGCWSCFFLDVCIGRPRKMIHAAKKHAAVFTPLTGALP